MFSLPRFGLLCLFFVSPVLADDLGLKVPTGFKVTQFSDEKLANDIYAMTLDAKGRVVVTSRGWVKRLEDTNGDGKADQATVIAETKTGGMGLLFDYESLFITCDGGLMRYEIDPLDKEEKYKFKEKWFDLAFSEHGGHAIRRGPDGGIYVIAGNDAGLQKYPLFKNTEGGGILRFKGKQDVKLIAHGFRNPYDFDFTPLGDIITYDSDTERDYLLPWYTPTRLFHVAIGQHHGWRLPGYMRSLARPDYYPDAVDVLANIGRGSPTGVVCYRHDQFPKHYRKGIFALDWTFGRVYYCPLTLEGSSYKTKPEIFLESTGNNGFAPTDVCVAPDGSLLISIGGRGTRGSVYRVEYVGDEKNPRMPKIPSNDWIDWVLHAPQPLDAWSRSAGDALLEGRSWDGLPRVFQDKHRPPSERIRAFELFLGRYNILSRRWFVQMSQEFLSMDRAHLISLVPFEIKQDENSPKNTDEAQTVFGPNGEYNVLQAILRLANDNHPRVRVQALNALRENIHKYRPDRIDQIAKIIVNNLNDPDKRIRLAALELLRSAPKEVRKRFPELISAFDSQVKLNSAIGGYDFALGDPLNLFYFLSALEQHTDAETLLPILRIATLTFGDWCLKDPPAEVYAAYAFQNPPTEPSPTLKHFTRLVRNHFPSKDHRVNMETTRFLAMIQDNDPEIVNKLLDQITPQSNPTDDVHYLIVLSRLQSPRTEEQTKRVASAILNLDKKFQGQQVRIKQNWNARLGEVLTNLLKQHLTLASEMVTHPDFLHPSHIGYALRFDPENRKFAAKFFLATVRKEVDFEWSAALVDLFAELSETEYRPLLRAHWNEYGIRENILVHLAKKPETIDRERFLWGLESSQINTVHFCLKALKEIPLSPEQMVPIFKLLRQSFRETNSSDTRSLILSLINHHLKQSFAIKETSKDNAALQKDYQLVFDFLEKNYPKQYQLLSGQDEAETTKWKNLLRETKWDQGDAPKGMKLFQNRSCATCHEGSSRIGPDLRGITNRFSRDDIFTAIIDPDRDVAPAFRMETIHLHDGKVVQGIVIFESADGVIVQLDATNTLRIGNAEVASRRATNRSLMPKNLLADLKSEDLADLYRYLQSLKER